MNTARPRRHLFISHHHQDDAEVTKLTNLLSGHGWDVRNSSIRMKPSNEQRREKGLIPDSVIERALRMRVSWAQAVVVLIGKDTHTRPWVNWEIEEAHRQGKRIVGVFIRGGTEADIPPALEKFATQEIVGWNGNAIIGALDGDNHPFQASDGSVRPRATAATTERCS